MESKRVFSRLKCCVSDSPSPTLGNCHASSAGIAGRWRHTQSIDVKVFCSLPLQQTLPTRNVSQMFHLFTQLVIYTWDFSWRFFECHLSFNPKALKGNTATHIYSPLRLNRVFLLGQVLADLRGVYPQAGILGGLYRGSFNRTHFFGGNQTMQNIW